MNVLASEWLKLRTVRSTGLLVGCCGLSVVAATVILSAMTRAYDAAAPAEQQAFGSADALTFATPLVQLLIAVFGGLAITGEYSSHTIATSLLAAPKRGVVLAAKCTLVGLSGLAISATVSVLCGLATVWVVGDRPAPFAPWSHLSDAVVPAVSESLVVTTIGLVALGLGTAIRSMAGTLVTMTLLLFVAPSLVTVAPAPWDQWLWAVLPTNLASQLSGRGAEILPTWGAVVVLVAYAAVSITVGALVLRTRDA